MHLTKCGLNRPQKGKFVPAAHVLESPALYGLPRYNSLGSIITIITVIVTALDSSAVSAES